MTRKEDLRAYFGELMAEACPEAYAKTGFAVDPELDAYRDMQEALHPGRRVKVWRAPDGEIDAEID